MSDATGSDGTPVRLTPEFIENAARAAHGMLWMEVRGTFSNPPPVEQTWEGSNEHLRAAWRSAVREAIGLTIEELARRGYLKEGVRA